MVPLAKYGSLLYIQLYITISDNQQYVFWLVNQHVVRLKSSSLIGLSESSHVFQKSDFLIGHIENTSNLNVIFLFGKI